MKLGIDLDTWKLTLCVLDGDAEVMGFVCFEQAKIRQPGQSIFDAVQGILPALSMAIDRTGVHASRIEEVYVERGRGQHRKGEYELGAMYGATAVAVRRCLPNSHIESVTVAEWKKMVTAHTGYVTTKGVPGNGNAPKEMANESCRQLLRDYGLDEAHLARLTPDELDAFGIVWSIGRELPPPADAPARPQSRAQAQIAL